MDFILDLNLGIDFVSYLGPHVGSILPQTSQNDGANRNTPKNYFGWSECPILGSFWDTFLDAFWNVFEQAGNRKNMHI